MFYRLHHGPTEGRSAVRSECLGQFWKAEVGQFWKAPKVLAVDPETGDRVSLFHPIREAWAEHFRFKSYEIEGLTASGRATIGALDMNRTRRQLIRKAEEAFGLFPPIP